MNDYITIPLSKTGKNAGKYEALVSVEDADLVAFNWSANPSVYTVYVHRVTTSNFIQTKHILHRIILQRILGRPLEKRDYVDHINKNGLDNRRENLRLATPSQNLANAGARKTSKTGVRGVYWYKETGKYRATIRINGRRVSLGLFTLLEDAEKAYNQAHKEIYGEFSFTNNQRK